MKIAEKSNYITENSFVLYRYEWNKVSLGDTLLFEFDYKNF